MLERHSALESVVPYYGTGLTISEASDFTLTQYAGNEKQLKKALGKIPVRVGISLEHESRTLLRISPSQIWLIGEPLKTEACCTTPLSSSRTRIALDGENARAILAKLAAIDFHRKKFKLGMFAQTMTCLSGWPPRMVPCMRKKSSAPAKTACSCRSTRARSPARSRTIRSCGIGF